MKTAHVTITCDGCDSSRVSVDRFGIPPADWVEATLYDGAVDVRLTFCPICAPVVTIGLAQERARSIARKEPHPHG